MRIGLVLNILDEEYQISLYKGIKQCAQKLGIQIICFQAENTSFSSNSFIGRFPYKEYFNLDGIILLTSVLVDNCQLNTKEDITKVWGDLPVISVGQKIEGIPSLLVQTDDSMKELVEHLINVHSYRNFVYIGGSQTHQDAINRENIFTQTIEKYQKQYPQIKYTIKRESFVEQGAVHAVGEYVYENPDETPDVIVCANDNMAIGVYKFLQINHENPHLQNIAVTGFDDIPQGQYSIPSLTTIHQPLDKIGVEAVNTIYKLVKNQKISMEKAIDSKVIYRESCGCKKNEGDWKFLRESFEKVQTSYVLSEQMLRIVSHIGHDLNNDDDDESMVSVIDFNTSILGINNYCVLKFAKKLKNSSFIKDEKLFVKPVYVRRQGKKVTELTNYEQISLGEFYKNFIEYDENCPKSLVFKFLNEGNDITGCVLYDSADHILPYLISISTNVGLTMSRIEENEKRKLRSEYLENEVEKRTKELVEANNKRMEVEAEVLKISEIERQRFSNDLHDDICQRLAGISMLCRSYSKQNNAVEKEQMEELAALVSDTLQRTRQYAHNSYPVDLENIGLNNSLNNLCNSFEQQSQIKCLYTWKIPDEIEFSKRHKLNIFRIIQEALHNVMKHSQAKKVIVNGVVEQNQIVITICDDGIGIEKEKLQNPGIGLNSMQYRANQIGAACIIKTQATGGTCVELKMELS